MNDAPRPNPMLDVLGEESRSPWTEADLAALFRHQLNARIEPEFHEWLPGILRGLRAGPAAPLLRSTFAEVLAHPNPPAELLAAIKDLGKAIAQHPDRGVPGDIGKMLYFLAISAAGAAGIALSELDPKSLSNGLQWAAARPWIDPEIRSRLSRKV